jgi:hypothetical protein
VAEPEVGRKVRQLGNDVNEIYELLFRISDTQARHGTALADLGGAVADIRDTQARHGSRLDALETRFDGLETRFDGLDVKFTGMFEGLDSKVSLIIDRIGHGGADRG